MKENDTPDSPQVPLPEIKRREEETTSIIKIVSKGGRLTVTTEFVPELDPKNPTFDQASAAIGLQAIAEFLKNVSDGANN